MCTVIIEVPDSPAGSVRVLAVRDEDPARAWDPPGQWWSQLPGVTGVRDRLAGGAWLAMRDDRLSVLLNRAGSGAPLTRASEAESRGWVVLADVTGTPPAAPRTAPFNLVTVTPGSATVTVWDGRAVRRETLTPGVHMLAHGEVDDPATPRIAAWLDRFRGVAGRSDDWRAAWLGVLERSAQLDPADDRAIVRDNRAHGVPTASLLVCLAEVRSGAHPAIDLRSTVLAEPARWRGPCWTRCSSYADESAGPIHGTHRLR